MSIYKYIQNINTQLDIYIKGAVSDNHIHYTGV